MGKGFAFLRTSLSFVFIGAILNRRHGLVPVRIPTGLICTAHPGRLRWCSDPDRAPRWPIPFGPNRRLRRVRGAAIEHRQQGKPTAARNPYADHGRGLRHWQRRSDRPLPDPAVAARSRASGGDEETAYRHPKTSLSEREVRRPSNRFCTRFAPTSRRGYLSVTNGS